MMFIFIGLRQADHNGDMKTGLMAFADCQKLAFLAHLNQDFGERLYSFVAAFNSIFLSVIEIFIRNINCSAIQMCRMKCGIPVMMAQAILGLFRPEK
jgi:uncharacterized protein YbgA (DUF1722 family)